ncbi:hypothetical protein WR25_17739 [Diploscapter pachys]|uniref:VWFA domain-containing protein n=1 Tax=Diploscapter pachys TaxID=2018661 RepID=A0A2A2LPH0_9BILA|nr:hypothetical protein WR25_17739 [Diploscapter pachys]
MGSQILVCFGSFHLAYGKNVDPECACNLGNLWLDVVIAIDNSQNKDEDVLVEIAANIATVFAQINITQALGQTTRIGIVTYGESAVVRYNLTAFNDTGMFMNAIFDVTTNFTTDTSYIYTGLATAQTVLHDGRANGKRDNVRRAIIVYASHYVIQEQENDPVQLAQEIKKNGIGIITVAFNQYDDELVLAEFAKIATPGMAFNDIDTDLVGEIQRSGLCQINCFCPGIAWTQYTSQFGLANARRFAVCLQLDDIDSMSWTKAKMACQHLDNSAYLVSEFNRAKHNFTYHFFNKMASIPGPYIYHIGLSWDASSQQWTWEQPANQPKIPLTNSSYAPWNPGDLTSPSTNLCVVNQQFAPARMEH